MVLAGQAVRAVALGVVVTALAQAVLGGIGLAISGVPYAALLTVVMIFHLSGTAGAAYRAGPFNYLAILDRRYDPGHGAAGVELRGGYDG